MTDLDVAILQNNPTIGDLKGNCEDIINAMNKCENADILITPELSLIGYPPMDILRRDKLYEVQDEKLNKIKKHTKNVDVAVLIGFCRRDSRGIYNSAVIYKDGMTVKKYDKILLPTYDVFDGHRYFETGDSICTFELNGETIGITICEDAWYNVDVMDTKRHKFNPFSKLKKDNPDVILNLSASPFRINKNKERIDLFTKHAIDTDSTIVFCNQSGGNDELVFDGNSFIVNSDRDVCQLNEFEEDFMIINSGQYENKINSRTDISEINSAICLGLEDYFNKTGFSKAIIGMSGGIDSTIATVLATEAFGCENVMGVSLPSEVTSDESIEHARSVANNLDIEFEVIDISNIVQETVNRFENQSDYSMKRLALENIQARIRGNILMSLSNRKNALVVTPDNKSESAIGYCTLYGDTVGAIAPLGDCYKKHVYELARYYNDKSDAELIPKEIILKQPTAELKENQVDTDDMAEYEILDTILNQYVENRKKPEEINVDTPEEIDRIISRIHGAEFKRNQSPLPIRITKKDFGRGWRYPIAADYGFLKSKK